jgi:hypothetical protein
MKILFPIKILSITINDFNDINYYLNFVWLTQITLCLICTIIKRRFVPKYKTNKTYILIEQIKIYFITQSIVYFFEIILTNLLITCFERFLHHVFAIILLLSTCYQSSIICVTYIVPVFVHSIYWSLTKTTSDDFNNIILFIYNLSLFISSTLFIKNVNLICYNIPFYATCISNVNLMGYLYDYNINLNYLNKIKFFESFFISTIISMPIYIYVFYRYTISFKSNKILKYEQV